MKSPDPAPPLAVGLVVATLGALLWIVTSRTGQPRAQAVASIDA